MVEWVEKAVAFIASYPLWAQILAVCGLGIMALTLIFAPREVAGKKPEEYGIKITSPRGGTAVTQSFTVEGTFEYLPKGPERPELWIITTDTFRRRYWPQKRAIASDGTWRGEMNCIGRSPGKKTFGVFLVGRDGQALLELWERAVLNQADIELEHLTQDMEMVAELDVVLEL